MIKSLIALSLLATVPAAANAKTTSGASEPTNWCWLFNGKLFGWRPCK